MNTKRSVKIIILQVLLVVALIALDQIVKHFAETNISPYTITPLIKGILDITYVQNTGAAFSLLSNSFYFLVAVRAIAGCAMVYILIRYHKRLHTLLRVSMCLVLAGALGNLVDQILLGHVRDMFAFRFVEFAVFNVADICITIGAVLLFIDLLFLRGRTYFFEKEKKDQLEEKSSGPQTENENKEG